MNIHDCFSVITAKATAAAGSIWAFSAALIVVIGWVVAGPFFDFSSTWMLFINTITTVITFIMVFIIQHAQNKENRAVQLKLNELIGATKGASNRLIAAEDLKNGELEYFHKRYAHLSKTTEKLEPGAKITIDKDDD